MSNTKSVDSSLWWEPFTSLLTDLEKASLSSQLPPHLEKKLKENHAWFVNTVSLFKPPNAKSREALNSSQLQIGSHQLSIKPELKDKALRISSFLALDEVQTYILVERCFKGTDAGLDSVFEEYLHVVLLDYYIERQCLLKCSRLILIHALYVGMDVEGDNFSRDAALKLISDGLETKLIQVLQDLLSGTHPEQVDLDLFTLWAEEMLTEESLVLDIFFLIYHESICTCNAVIWEKLCSFYKGILCGTYNSGKLAISTEGLKSYYYVKVQLLLILIRTLDLENLLRLLHDGTPFRQGASIFSLNDIQQMNVLVSTFDTVEMKEAGPLILAWATCLCLISSLPREEDNNGLMEIDHVGYVRQAFEASSLRYLLEILESDILKESDGPLAGYRSVLRTIVSAFIASYDINVQLEDNTLNLILDILCKIYQGEESLCSQFWDRESFVDEPIRCLLRNLERDFPFRTVELVRLLSSLCEGSWPAECVYNFLDKTVGISSLFEITAESLVDDTLKMVETHLPLHVPGVECLLIPSKTQGHVLQIIRGNTALVRWEYAQSGVVVLVLRLAHELHLESKNEVLLILDLLNRIVSFNTAVTFSLMDIGTAFYFNGARTDGQIEENFWVVDVICAIIKKFPANSGGAAVMSMSLSILAKMLKCAPYHVVAAILKTNIFEMAPKTIVFDAGFNGSSGSWLLSGKLAKMLLVDYELNESECPLAISVLDFTMQLLETRLENDIVQALVVFSLQYILVNHGYWKYKAKHFRWKVTVKVLELMKKCMMPLSFSGKLGMLIRDILLGDYSIHNVLLHLVCTTKQTLENLYVSRLYEPMEIEGFELAICSALDVVHILLSEVSKDVLPSLPIFYQAVLSSTTKPIPVVAAAISLTSYFRNTEIQVGAARVLSLLLMMADYVQPYASGFVCFGLDDKQTADLRDSSKIALLDQLEWNEDLFIAIVKMLTSAARYQPAYLAAILTPKEESEVQLRNTSDLNKPINRAGPLESRKPSLVDAIIQYLERSDDFINSNPRLLFSILDFLKALWQGAAHYISILEHIKKSRKFWKQMSNCFSLADSLKTSATSNWTTVEAQTLAYKYQCQSAILEIISLDIFLQKKLVHAESLLKEASESKESTIHPIRGENSKTASDSDLKDILSSWFDESIFGSLVNLYTSCEYENEICYRAKVAASLFTVHLMGKIAAGSMGSLSVSLLETIRLTSTNLSCQLPFSELLAQYSQRGYSEGNELNRLVLNDLYYHLQGELEGRRIISGPFKELLQYLLESKCFQAYKQKYDDEHFPNAKEFFLYDLMRIKSDLGFSMWDYTEWNASKAIAETMFECMQEANSMNLLACSKLSVLQALITVLTVYEDNSVEKKATSGGKTHDELRFSCIDDICHNFHTTMEALGPLSDDATEEVLGFLTAQAELLLHLVRSVQSSLSSSVCVLVLKTSSSGLKTLNDRRSYVTGLEKTTKLLLMLLLLVLEMGKTSGKDSEDHAEVTNVCLGLLPTLCNYVSRADHFTLSLTAVDLILREFLTPSTWFPVIQKHLQLQTVISKLQEQKNLESAPMTLKFLLTLARVKGSAEMLIGSGFFTKLKVLFTDLSAVRPSSLNVNDSGFSKPPDGTDKPQHVWGLGLAVITAMVHSLGDGSSCARIMDKVIPYLFSEKAHLISSCLNVPDFPSDSHDKKRARAQRSQTSLLSLKETEHTLMLMCTLAKHWSSWVKGTKEMDSQLREKSIHLLAFVSRGFHRFGESPSRTPPLACPPVLKEEHIYCKKPSFLKSRNGWFSLSPACCATEHKSSIFTATSTALVVRDGVGEVSNHESPTYFSDLVALQIYRITFLVLKFLCLEAEGAAVRSEEVGYVDLAHIPELPMPEILHGLQDQASAIVSEVCNANKGKKDVDPEIQSTCVLLLEILEMAMYLERYVVQICGIRAVLGRVEDLSKEVKLLMKAMEGHAFLNGQMKSLEQIVSFLYPRLL